MTPPNDGLAFFRAYEQSLQSPTPDWSQIYHQSFLFGGPHGAQSVQLTDFLKVVPHRTKAAQSLGLASTKLLSVETSILDNSYWLAKVVWQITVSRPGRTTTLDASATYILRNDHDTCRIVAQLDSEDLMAKIGALGKEVTPQSSPLA
jgi:hypothetical protein